MLVNARKTKAMAVSRSLTVLPRFPPLLLDGRVLACEEMLRILGLNVDCKLTFESHLRAVAASAGQKLGIMRRAWSVFRDVDLTGDVFGVLFGQSWSTVLLFGHRLQSIIWPCWIVSFVMQHFCVQTSLGVIWDTEGMWPLCACIIKLGRILPIPSMTGCRILLFPHVIHVKL